MNNIEDKINHLLQRLKADEQKEKQQELLAKKLQKRQEKQQKKEKYNEISQTSKNECQNSRESNQIPNTADLVLSAAKQCIFFDKESNKTYKTTTIPTTPQ
jgi:hypothetical protein